MSFPAFTAALIAGGKSSRMGFDKALLELDGVPLWRRQIELLETLQPAEILVSGPANGPWSGYCRSVEDARPALGPLSGISAILEAAASELVLVLAVDLPRMNFDFLTRLLLSANSRGAIPKRGEIFEPLVAIYPKQCAPFAHESLRVGDLSLQKFCHAAVGAGLAVSVNIDAKDERLFANANTPSDFAALR